MFKFKIDQYLKTKIPKNDPYELTKIYIEECFNYYLNGDYTQCETCANLKSVNSAKIYKCPKILILAFKREAKKE